MILLFECHWLYKGTLEPYISIHRKDIPLNDTLCKKIPFLLLLEKMILSLPGDSLL